MKEFKNKVAVITGAANGIGKALAIEAALREMKVVITDIDRENLALVEKELNDMGADVLALISDATEYDAVEQVAQDTLKRFGQVDLLVNNAGVVVEGKVWEIPTQDMDYIVDSNLYSVLYGIKAFVPIMLEQNTDCHIINVASIAGLISSPTMPTYHMTKFGNIGLSESVNYQLQEIGSKIKMSVFCPGYIQTDLHNCDTRREGKFAMGDNPYYQSPEYAAGQRLASHVINTGMPIDSIGMQVFQGIEDENFYILTHPAYQPLIGLRVKTILDGMNPDVGLFKRQ